MVRRRHLSALLLSLILFVPGCLGGGDDSDMGMGEFPSFHAMADDGESHTNADYAGEGLIVLFSAEWCNAPCHSVMHFIYDNLGEEPNVIIMSTDKTEDITLEEWHEDANDFDDEEGDPGNNLPWPYMKGVTAAETLKVVSRPTVFFVDGDGIIRAKNEGAFHSEQALLDMWATVS